MEIDGVAHVRERPGLYLGSTSSSGVAHMVLEVLSNCFDLVLAGTATTVTVAVDRSGTTFSVVDDGPGIDVAGRTGPTFEQLFTTVRDTPTADGHWPHLHLAIGCGLGPVCALASELDVTVHRADGTYRQSFSRGIATTDLVRSEPVVGPTGTTVRLTVDPEVFTEVEPAKVTARLTEELRELAFLTPGLVTRLEVEGAEPTVFGPVEDLRPLFDHVFADHRHPFETDAPLVLATATDDVAVDALLTWSTHRWSADVHAYGNYRHLAEPERVLQGLEEGLRSVLGAGPVVDVMHGLRALVHVRLIDPVFPGPTGRRLVSPEAIWAVADTVAAQLPAQLARHPELAADLASRVPTRQRVLDGSVADRWSRSARVRRNTPS